jgi:hypothetical protein
MPAEGYLLRAFFCGFSAWFICLCSVSIRGLPRLWKGTLMQTYDCTLQLGALPRFVKACPHCKSAYFENSGCFRVNANGKRLDVWLICRCEHCKSTWNLSIFDRIDRNALRASVYEGYLANERELILQHVFDPAFQKKNRAIPDQDSMDISIHGNIPPEHTAAQVFVSCTVELPLPAGRAIALVLGASLSRVRHLAATGLLIFEGDLRKTKAGVAFAFTLAEGWTRNASH